MSSTDKIGEALSRSLPYVPEAAKGFVQSLLKPETLVFVGATLIVWAGSHAFGAGEIVDAILLGVGVIGLGFSVFDGAGELLDFATGAIGAHTDHDLEVAGRHFGRAVTILGVSVLQVVLLRGQGRTVIARGRPQLRPRVNVGAPPPPGNGLSLSRPAQIASGSLGETSAYGAITVARNQAMTEQRLTLLHELVHRFFSPRVGPLRQLRAELSMTAYARSALMRYLEEALAEGFAQLRVNGLAQALGAINFPLANGYVTITQLVCEANTIGSITIGGAIFYVSISQGRMPHD